ncbi:unnamed protein product [Acanthoscelides obtectus]|uniref:Uncharacterized protein n=1 Tax=Acanthoscelides obtectus TaxID=200917 RepID=A0A9P0NYK2_ACAOB|nr:unnamed protein product [Acanthoscelides obtectus]CAK1625474.1 hypothetical protein AOBTE_LOCUS3184 [Acanthoscelides obtectus]
MFANTAARLAQRIQPTAVNSARNMSVLSGPPQVRISFAEKVIHGIAITVGIMAVPAWVLLHIRSYRGLD